MPTNSLRPQRKFARGLLLSTVASTTFFACSAAHAQNSDAQQDGEAETFEEIVVTGSYIARSSQESLSSPTVVMGAQQIARTGVTGVDDLLQFNTANTGSIGGAQDLAGGGADDRDTRSANLRGLGVQSTLVLMNGRRVANTDGYTNLVALTPAIAVKRVETVLDGASATYGSDAIAGVMNIITDGRFEGLKLSGQYTNISDAPRYIVEGMLGAGNDRFHAVLSASYEYQDKLQGYEREVTNFDNTSGLAQPGNYILASRPVASGGGDVIIDNGINGAINYSQLYDQISARTGSSTVQFADPWCTDPDTGGIYAGSNDFPDGACRFSYQQRNPIKPRSRVTLVHLDTEYEISPEHTLYFEGRYYQQGTERFGIASFPITTGTLVVPADNPYNPFGIDVTFAGRLLGNKSEDRVERVDVDSIHLVTGLKGDLPVASGWSYNVTGVYSREDYTLYSNDTDMISAQNAFNGYGGADCQVSSQGVPSASEVAGQGNCVYFSPFGRDQQLNDSRATYNLLSPFQRSEASELRYVEAVVTGDLFSLPGGDAGVAIGGQIREESQSIDLDSGLVNGRFGFQGKSLPGEGERTIKSIFSELYLPVSSTIDIQLAARYEDYGLFDTFDPKVGVNWRPADWIAVRGSYSTAFRAPDVQETVSDQVTSTVGQTVDPLDSTDVGTFRVVRTVSNPDLKPEQSRNFNLGVSVEPIESLNLSVDYFDFKFTDQIALEAAQQVINADPNGSRLERDEFGRLLAVNIGYFNSGQTRTNGFDFRASYNMDVGSGVLSFENMASLVTTYEVQLGPDSAVIDALGGRNATNPGAPTPKFRNNLRVSYAADQHAGNVAMRYISSVSDDVGGGTVGSWTVFDAQYAFTFGSERGATITVGANNVFNTKPPSAAFTGYLPSLHDALGRQAYIRLSVEI